MFLHVQSIQTSRVDYPYFFQTSFFSTNCAQLLLKVRDDFNIDVYKGKKSWMDDFFFITNFNTFGSNVLLTLKIIDFENMTLTKVVHVYMIEGMNA